MVLLYLNLLRMNLMLISFKIGNFLVFNSPVELEMLPAKIRKHKEHILKGKAPVLNSAVLYGANAAGKSNFLEALRRLVTVVRNHGDTGDLVMYYNIHQFSEDDIATFEIKFQSDKRIYSYYIAVRKDESVFEESLKILNSKLEEKDIIFKRSEDNHVEYNENLDKINWYKYRTCLKTTLLLSKLKDDGILEQPKLLGQNLFKEVYDFFNNFSFYFQSFIEERKFSAGVQNKEGYQKFLLDLLKNADLGINELKWEKLDDATLKIVKIMNTRFISFEGKDTFFVTSYGNELIQITVKDKQISAYTLSTIHNQKPFKMLQESRGTQKIIELSLLFYQALELNKKVLIIDEFDSSVHPILVKHLLKTILPKLKEKSSQLIISLHDTALLTQEIWRNDEVWFVEKRVDGSSDLYSLQQFAPRFDKKLSNDYMHGKYGAIPILSKGIIK